MTELLDIQELNLAYSGGRQIVRVGARFHDRTYGGDWEVVGFTGYGGYSPSGLGGTPDVECKPLGELPEYWRKWVKSNGNVDWCGDSVASCIARNGDVSSPPDREAK